MTPRIVSASENDVDEVADLIAGSFQRLAVAHWLAADPAARFETMRSQFAILIAHAFEYGFVYIDAGRTGAAVWFDRTRLDSGPPDYDRRLQEICGPHTPRFTALDEAFAAHHPPEGHHHAAFLGVREGYQSRGVGTALMAHHHRWLDTQGVPAYLEASSPDNRDFYARQGYFPISVIELPDGPKMWPMWREPV